MRTFRGPCQDCSVPVHPPRPMRTACADRLFQGLPKGLCPRRVIAIRSGPVAGAVYRPPLERSVPPARNRARTKDGMKYSQSPQSIQGESEAAKKPGRISVFSPKLERDRETTGTTGKPRFLVWVLTRSRREPQSTQKKTRKQRLFTRKLTWLQQKSCSPKW